MVAQEIVYLLIDLNARPVSTVKVKKALSKKYEVGPPLESGKLFIRIELITQCSEVLLHPSEKCLIWWSLASYRFTTVGCHVEYCIYKHYSYRTFQSLL